MRALNQRVTPEGRRVVDLVDDDGTTIIGAPTLSGAALPLTVPLESESAPGTYQYYPEVLVGIRPGQAKPVVLGVMDNGRVLFKAREEAEEYTGGASDPEDVDDDVQWTYLEDAMVASPKAALALRHTGEATLEATRVNVQIPEGGVVRVSEGGNTSGRYPLAGPLLAYIRELRGSVVELRQAVLDLQAALQRPRLANENGGALTSPAGAVTGTVGAPLGSPVYSGEPTPDFDEPTLTSAILRVSTRVEES